LINNNFQNINNILNIGETTNNTSDNSVIPSGDSINGDDNEQESSISNQSISNSINENNSLVDQHDYNRELLINL